MRIEHVAVNLERRAQKSGLNYTLGAPASAQQILQAEQRFGVAFPAQTRLFYQHYNGLEVAAPSLTVLPLEQMSFLAPGYLHIATIDHQHHLYFDTTALNPAEQWDIVTVPAGFVVTRTMASFWSNKIWAWIDKGRAIWQKEVYDVD